jgi:hypothetical protein
MDQIPVFVTEYINTACPVEEREALRVAVDALVDQGVGHIELRTLITILDRTAATREGKPLKDAGRIVLFFYSVYYLMLPSEVVKAMIALRDYEDLFRSTGLPQCGILTAIVLIRRNGKEPTKMERREFMAEMMDAMLNDLAHGSKKPIIEEIDIEAEKEAINSLLLSAAKNDHERQG